MGLWSSFSLCLVLWIVATAGEERNATLVKHSDRRGKALKISKKPCTDPNGKKGICTFKWDCINNNGTLMGTCVDGFIFGTCCHFGAKDLLHSSSPHHHDHDHDLLSLPDSNKIVDNAIEPFPTTTTERETPSSTTTTTTTTPDTRRPIQIITLGGIRKPNSTPAPVVATAASSSGSGSSTTIPSSGGQLVTWTSIGPTKRPQRPIILQPFPFRPGAHFPTIQGGWPMGVAFPVDPFQVNRPLQVYRPPTVLLQNAQSTIVSHAPVSPAVGQGNASYTILDGPDGNGTSAGNLKGETTTISVPIPQWSTVSQSTVDGSTLTSRPQILTSINFTSAAQSSSPSTGRPLKNPLDYRKDCGVRTIGGPRARIVGGQSATFGRWPWQVLVKEAAWLGLYQKNKCGGVLVSSKYAITAGHCQPGRFLSALVVILGEYDLLSDLERLKPEMRRVKRMIVHRHYNPQNFDNDIAVLELDPPVNFRPHIAPICLPEPNEDFTGRMAYVTGWGKTSHGGVIPNLLQEVQVPIMSNSECVKMFKEAGHAKLIKESFLCAGYKTGGKDSCEGDSGGPLMVERPSGQWVLVGTVSHGIRCADPNLPGVYMKISAYRSWIDKIIK